MPQRVPDVGRDELDAAGQAVYDTIAGSRGSVRGPFAVLLHHPALADKVAALGAEIRYAGRLNGAERELAIIVVARHLEAPVEWSAHYPLAVKEGANADALEAVSSDGPTDKLQKRDRLIIDSVRTLLHKSRLSEAEYRALEAEFTTAVAIEIMVLAGYYNTLGFVLNSLDVPAGSDVPLPWA